jgi:high-affinity Fe2+/Pb2+ permease
MDRLKTIGMSILLIQNLMTMTLAVRYNIIAMAGVAIDDVRYATMMMLFINSSLKSHLLMTNMILMLIFLGNWLLNKNLHALNFLKMIGLE